MQSDTNLPGYALPADPNPPDTICFQIPVPNDPAYIWAFFGVIKDLATWINWQRDDVHTGRLAAARWRPIFIDLITGKLNCVPNSAIGGAVQENEQMLRINPDNPCIIQQFCDPDWVDWFDASNCVAAAAAQQTGGGQPEPGQSACYNAVLQGNGLYLLPAQVSEGDTITVTDAGGGWTDGSGQWSCPDGKHYALGTCIGGTESHHGGDPLPSAFHASIIMKIDGVFYPATAAPFVVPSGVSNKNVEFQMNDPSLSDNAGSVHFKACLTAQNITVNINGVTGSGGTIPTILSKTSLHIGDVFTCSPQFNSSNGFYDGGFHSDTAATWHCEATSNYTNGPTGCDWQWEGGACHNDEDPAGLTSPASTVGWVGNSPTAYTIQFKLVSIP